MAADGRYKKMNGAGCWRCGDGALHVSERGVLSNFYIRVCAACMNQMNLELDGDQDFLACRHAHVAYSCAVNRGDEALALKALDECDRTERICHARLRAMFDEYGKALDVIEALEEDGKHTQADSLRAEMSASWTRPKITLAAAQQAIKANRKRKKAVDIPYPPIG